MLVLFVLAINNSNDNNDYKYIATIITIIIINVNLTRQLHYWFKVWYILESIKYEFHYLAAIVQIHWMHSSHSLNELLVCCRNRHRDEYRARRDNYTDNERHRSRSPIDRSESSYNRDQHRHSWLNTHLWLILLLYELMFLFNFIYYKVNVCVYNCT